MKQKEYKQKLRNFFSSLSKNDSEHKKLKKIDDFRAERGIQKYLKIAAIFLLSVFSCAQLAFAAPTSLIPKEEITSEKPYNDPENELARSFQTGQFEIWQLGDYAIYLIELLIFFAGGISVLFIVVGGYEYMIGGVTEDKEAGKKTIGYAVTGFVISLLAWTIVEFVQIWITSGGA